jgi:hypothetical protein
MSRCIIVLHASRDPVRLTDLLAVGLIDSLVHRIGGGGQLCVVLWLV